MKKRLFSALLFLMFMLSSCFLASSAQAQEVRTTEQEIELLGRFLADGIRNGTAEFRNGIAGTKTKVGKPLREGIRSEFIFTISKQKHLELYEWFRKRANLSIYYLLQALARYPELCVCYTSVDLYGGTDREEDITFVLYSPVNTFAEAKYYISRYQSWIENVSAIPLKEYKAKRMSMEDVMLYFHNEVVTNCEYSTQFRDGNQTAVSDFCPFGGAVALEKPYGSGTIPYSVCESYSIIYNQLLHYVFVTHGAEIGWTGGPVCWVMASKEHAWNAVRLKGKYYYVDVTWDDPVKKKESYCKYKYFLVSAKAFQTLNDKKDHTLLLAVQSMFPNIRDARLGTAYDSLFMKNNDCQGTRFYWSSAAGKWMAALTDTEGKTKIYTWSFSKKDKLSEPVNSELPELNGHQDIHLFIPNRSGEDYPGLRQPRYYESPEKDRTELILLCDSEGVYFYDYPTGKIYKYRRSGSFCDAYTRQGNVLMAMKEQPEVFRYYSICPPSSNVFSGADRNWRLL